jgi:ankyrin repeat protein
MHLAAAKGHLRCLELLTEHGGLLLARDKRGETVLQLAERMNQEDVIHHIARHSAQHPLQVKVNAISANDLDDVLNGEGDENSSPQRRQIVYFQCFVPIICLDYTGLPKNR